MVKEFLSQRGVGYEERDVSRNQAFARELVNASGQMGVPVTVYERQVVVGFDRPRLEQVVNSIQTVARPSFGASVADAARITAGQGPTATTGAYVGSVRPNSVAQQLGLAQGDIIIEINMKKIGGAADIQNALSTMKKGDRLWVTFLRGGSSRKVEGAM